MSHFRINNREIGPGMPPYVIAEMSGNHNQSFDQAIAILDAAVRAGASALKLQIYTADTLTIDSDKSDFFINNNDSIWKGNTLYKLYESAYTKWDWIASIMVAAADRGIDCFSSVFDESSIDFMENLNVCAYKIASFENNHIPLIRKAASTKKPLIISTGMATYDEIQEAVDNAREAGCVDLALLKCTSDYPATISESNISAIPYLKEKFSCEVGLSDHTLGIGVAIASIGIGGTIIEKHFTTSREVQSVDSTFSADEDEFTLLVRSANEAADSIGSSVLGISEGEKKSIQFRRSIYASKPIKSGEKLTEENIRIIRPGYGLHPRYYSYLIGRISHKDLDAGDRIDDSFID